MSLLAEEEGTLIIKATPAPSAEEASRTTTDSDDEVVVDLAECVYGSGELEEEFENFNHLDKDHRATLSSWMSAKVSDCFACAPGSPLPAQQHEAWDNFIEAWKRGPYRNNHLLPAGALYMDQEIRERVLSRVRKRMAHRRKVIAMRLSGVSPARAREEAVRKRARSEKKTPLITKQQRKTLLVELKQQEARFVFSRSPSVYFCHCLTPSPVCTSTCTLTLCIYTHTSTRVCSARRARTTRGTTSTTWPKPPTTARAVSAAQRRRRK